MASNNTTDLFASLTAALKDNTQAVGEAAAGFKIFNDIIPAIHEMNKASLAVGIKFEDGAKHLHKQLKDSGIKFGEAANKVAELMSAGAIEFQKAAQTQAKFSEQNTKALGKSLAQIGQLGKNMKLAMQATRANVQALGMNATQAIELQEHLKGTAVAFGLDMDSLSNSMAALGKSIRSSAVLFGAEFAKDVQGLGLAVQGMTGGALGSEGVEAIKKLFGGSMESMIRLVKLGVTPGADPAQSFISAMTKVQGMMPAKGVGGLGGAAQLEAMAGAFGIDENFFVLADAIDRSSMTLSEIQAKIEESNALDLLTQDLQANLNVLQNQLISAVTPLVDAMETLVTLPGVLTTLKGIATILGMFYVGSMAQFALMKGIHAVATTARFLAMAFDKNAWRLLMRGIKLGKNQDMKNASRIHKTLVKVLRGQSNAQGILKNKLGGLIKVFSFVGRIAGRLLPMVGLFIGAMTVIKKLFGGDDEEEKKKAAKDTAANTKVLAEKAQDKTIDVQQVIAGRMQALLVATESMSLFQEELLGNINDNTAEPQPIHLDTSIPIPTELPAPTPNNEK